MTNDDDKAKLVRLSVVSDFLKDCKATATSTADVIDSVILAGLSFFTAFAGTYAVNLPVNEGLTVAIISSGTQFFTVLALKRGLNKPSTQANT